MVSVSPESDNRRSKSKSDESSSSDTESSEDSEEDSVSEDDSGGENSEEGESNCTCITYTAITVPIFSCSKKLCNCYKFIQQYYTCP